MKYILSPIKNPGGCRYKIKHILPAILWKEIYCEPCAGGLSVLLNSPRITTNGKPILKYAFDTNELLINTWKFIQTEPERLQKFLRNVSYDEENFSMAKKYIRDHEKNVDDDSQWFMLACMYLVRNRFSRSADEVTYGYSPRQRRGMDEYKSAFLSMIDTLPEVSERIRDVVFMTGDCLSLIYGLKLNENPDVVYFIDPPFVHSTRQSKGLYKEFEMATYCRDAINKDGDHVTSHECLCYDIVNSFAGDVYLLGYENELYNKVLGLPAYSFTTKCSAGQTLKKSSRQDCLWVVKGSG